SVLDQESDRRGQLSARERERQRIAEREVRVGWTAAVIRRRNGGTAAAGRRCAGGSEATRRIARSTAAEITGVEVLVGDQPVGGLQRPLALLIVDVAALAIA